MQFSSCHLCTWEIFVWIHLSCIHRTCIEHQRMVLAPKAHAIKTVHIHPVAIIDHNIFYTLFHCSFNWIIMQITNQSAHQKVRAVISLFDHLKHLIHQSLIIHRVVIEMLSCKDIGDWETKLLTAALAHNICNSSEYKLLILLKAKCTSILAQCIFRNKLLGAFKDTLKFKLS